MTPAPLTLDNLREWVPRIPGNPLYTDPRRPTYLSIHPLSNGTPVAYIQIDIQSHYPGVKNKAFGATVGPRDPAHTLLIENIESEKPYPPFMLLDLLSDLIPGIQEYLTQVQYSP